MEWGDRLFTPKLKSDRFGMEISWCYLLLIYTGQHFVKIRPFRYGNIKEVGGIEWK